MMRAGPTALSNARVQGVTSVIGLVGAVLLIVHARYSGEAIMPSYLFVWLFLLGLSLGSMALICVHNLTGGDWGELARPALAALLRMLPYCALLGIPVLLRLSDLYPWMRSNDSTLPDLEPVQSWYLNVAFFWVRWLLYFSVWILLTWLLGRSSQRARAPFADASAALRLRALSAVSLLVYLLTMTFASIDWTMSLTPQWYSTEFGLLTGIGQCLSALAFSTVAAVWFEKDDRDTLRPRFHDLGNLLLALILFWSYLAYMQFLIMWIEDLPHDIGWYLPRTRESWRDLTVFLVFVHFAIPFFALLFRRLKRSPLALGLLATVILFACFADTFWLVIPPFRPKGFEVRWNDLFALLALGGVWLGLLMRTARTSAVDPLRDQILQQAVRHA